MNHIEAQEYCSTILQHFSAKLSAWEDRFIKDIQANLKKGYGISPGQAKKLDEIMEKLASSHS